VRECGRVDRYSRHRTAERPQLRDTHHRGRGRDVLQDRVGLGRPIVSTNIVCAVATGW
jgi:hypothetical protein